MKLIGLIVLCVCVLVADAAIQVSDASQFIALISKRKNASEWNEIQVMEDLNFSQVTLDKPLGLQPNGECIPMRGLIKGGNHSITDLKMLNPSSGSGLFCNMNSVTIESLLIDKSCRFVGSYAGSLAGMVSGSVTISNVINKASVVGSSSSGGLIGFITNASKKIVSIINSENHGAVTGKDGWVGGFVGSISETNDTTVFFSNNHNHGRISGQSGNGGLIGCINSTNDTVILIDDSSVHSVVTGRGAIGGFIGLVQKNINLELYAEESNNNCQVTPENQIQNPEDGFGGFIGLIQNNNNMSLMIDRCNNNQSIHGSGSTGGFVGNVKVQDNQIPSAIYFTDCSNHGTIKSISESSCGFICIQEESVNHVSTSFFNCKNDGNVSGVKAYGISNVAHYAINVVGMGFVSGGTGSYPLWNTSLNTKTSFVFDKVSDNNHNETLFAHCQADCHFCVKDEYQLCVMDLLNSMTKSLNVQGAFQWDENLNMADPVGDPSSAACLKMTTLLVLAVIAAYII